MKKPPLSLGRAVNSVGWQSIIEFLFSIPLYTDATVNHFNPRTPRGVRLFCPNYGAAMTDISIHAPRGGCDAASVFYCRRIDNFNPRTPRGVRPEVRKAVRTLKKFQPTHPAGGATDPLRALGRLMVISIHAPRGGCDRRSPPGAGGTG